MRLLLTSLALAACATAGGALHSEDAVVLPGSAVTMMLHQCSRGTPEAGEASWQPGGEDIAALEAALWVAVQAQPRRWPIRTVVPNGWLSQHVGIVRDGRRFVYGNYFPRDVATDGSDPNRWRTEPVIVCDGGPAFFGVEYDVEAGRITHLDFNGFP